MSNGSVKKIKVKARSLITNYENYENLDPEREEPLSPVMDPTELPKKSGNTKKLAKLFGEQALLIQPKIDPPKAKYIRVSERSGSRGRSRSRSRSSDSSSSSSSSSSDGEGGRRRTSKVVKVTRTSQVTRGSASSSDDESRRQSGVVIISKKEVNGSAKAVAVVKKQSSKVERRSSSSDSSSDEESRKFKSTTVVTKGSNYEGKTKQKGAVIVVKRETTTTETRQEQSSSDSSDDEAKVQQKAAIVVVKKQKSQQKVEKPTVIVKKESKFQAKKDTSSSDSSSDDEAKVQQKAAVVVVKKERKESERSKPKQAAVVIKKETNVYSKRRDSSSDDESRQQKKAAVVVIKKEKSRTQPQKQIIVAKKETKTVTKARDSSSSSSSSDDEARITQKNTAVIVKKERSSSKPKEVVVIKKKEVVKESSSSSSSSSDDEARKSTVVIVKKEKVKPPPKYKGRKVLLVFSHVFRESFEGGLVWAAAKELKDNGAEVQYSNLYDMGFNPVASPKDFGGVVKNKESYNYAVLAGEAKEQRRLAQDIESEQDKVAWADLILVVSQLQNHGLPALMKGWFDRIMSYGFAFKQGQTYENGRLRGKRVLLCLTSEALASMYTPTGLHGDMDIFLWPLLNGVLRISGFDILQPVVYFGGSSASEEFRVKTAATLQYRLSNIWQEEPLRFIPANKFKDKYGFVLRDKDVVTLEAAKQLTVGQHGGKGIQAQCQLGLVVEPDKRRQSVLDKVKAQGQKMGFVHESRHSYFTSF